MAKSIFILGCGTMQRPALRIAREMGWTVHAADGNPRAEGREACDVFHHVDLKDIDGLIETARAIRRSGGLDGVFTAGTDFSYSVARVAEALDLPGHAPEAARLATDKTAMRRCFREAGIPSPMHVEVGPGDDAAAAAQDVPGPWVVKPVDSMGARGVMRIDEATDLEPALEDARRHSRSGRALLESFMPGPEFSLDALVEDGRVIRSGLADRRILYPPYFIEVGHTIPSGVSEDVADALWDCFRRGIEALGLTRGAAKGDVKLTPNGPMIGEIAARLSGGYMSGWTWPCASGLEPTRGALRLAVGLPADLGEAAKNLVCAERALVGIDGTVRRLDGHGDALGLPGVEEVFLRYRPGDRLRFPRNNVEKAGNVIVTGADEEQAGARAEAALRALRLELDPGDPATGAYLDGEGPFPPDAFTPEDGAASAFFAYLEGLWDRCPPNPSRGCPEARPAIPPIPGSDAGDADVPTDLAGRSPRDVLETLASEGRLVIPAPGSGIPEVDEAILSDFWKALVRGGLAGARWYLERRS